MPNAFTAALGLILGLSIIGVVYELGKLDGYFDRVEEERERD